MGYAIPASSPSIKVGDRTIAVAAHLWISPLGGFYQCGVYEMINGGWNLISPTFLNTEDLVGEIAAKGGTVKFLKWLVDKINEFLTATFGAIAPPVLTEPTTNEEAETWIIASFAQLKLTLVNGVPTVS